MLMYRNSCLPGTLLAAIMLMSAVIVVALFSPAMAKPKGWLGVNVREMTPSLRQEYELGERSGLLITHVVPDSPADDAGLWEDDVIISFNGTAVEIADEFSKLVRQTAPDSTVRIKIVRAGRDEEFDVTLEKLRSSSGWPVTWSGGNFRVILNQPGLGVQVHELNTDLASYFNVEAGKGVLITEVMPDGSAEKAGLKAGDVIVKLEGEDVRDHQDVIDILSDYEEGDSVKLEYIRKGKSQTAEVEIEGGSYSGFHFGDPGDFHIPRFELQKPGRIRMHRGDEGSILRDRFRIMDRSRSI